MRICSIVFFTRQGKSCSQTQRAFGTVKHWPAGGLAPERAASSFMVWTFKGFYRVRVASDWHCSAQFHQLRRAGIVRSYPHTPTRWTIDLSDLIRLVTL